MSELKLRTMELQDLQAVSALGARSKASWGYGAEEMRIFAEELAITPGRLASLAHAWVIEDGSQIVGYFTLCRDSRGALELEHLFVAPERFGKGIGSSMLNQALQLCRGMGSTELKVIADPNSVGFYAKFGAKVVGEHQSSIAGRAIPVLVIPVGETAESAGDGSP